MSTNTKYDFSMFEDKSTDKYDFSMFDVKKKDFSQEELEAAKTSLQGYSEAPSQLEYEVPSTTDEQPSGIATVSAEELGIEEQPKHNEALKQRLDDKLLSIYKMDGKIMPSEKISQFVMQQENILKDFQQNAVQWFKEGQSEEDINNRYKNVLKSVMDKYGLKEEEGQITLSKDEIDYFNKAVEDATKSVLNDVENEARQELIDKYKDQGFFTEMWRELKSKSTRMIGGVAGLKYYIDKNVFELITAPLLKASGNTDEEINLARESFMDIPSATFSTASQSQEARQKLNEYAASVEETMKQYSNDIIGDIAEGNIGSAARQLTKVFVGSLPYMALTAATAGAGAEISFGAKAASLFSTLGTVAASQRLGEIEEGGLLPGEYKKQLLDTYAYGGFEAGGELFTMGIFDNLFKALKLIPKTEIASQSKNIAKTFLYETLGEGVSEGMITDLGQQLSDYALGITDSIDFRQTFNASIGGSFAATPLAGTTSIANSIKGSRIATEEDIKKVNENVADITELAAKKRELEISEEADIINEEINSLVAENQEIFDKNIDIAKNLTEEEFNKVQDIDQRLVSLSEEIAIKEEDGVSTKAEELLFNKLKQQREEILTPKETISEQAGTRQISTEIVEPTKTMPEEKEALKTDILQHKNIKDIKETLQGEKRDNDADVGRRSVGKNEILENKAKDLEIQIKNLRDENGNIPKENIAKFEKLKDQINKLRRGLETTDQIKERVDKFSSDEMLVSTLSGKTTLSPDELSIISDKMRQEGFSQDDIDYIFEDRGDKNKIYNRYYERAKNRGKYYAKEQQSRTLREQGVEVGEVEGVSDKDMPEIDRTKLQDGEEIKEELAPKDQFKKDFLSDEVNLNQIDVPLNMKERKAARKNLLEGKVTKQAQILEDYINKSFEKGNLDLVAIAAGGGTVRTQAPITEIIKSEPVVEKPVSSKIEPTEKPIAEKPVEDKGTIKIPKGKKAVSERFLQKEEAERGKNTIAYKLVEERSKKSEYSQEEAYQKGAAMVKKNIDEDGNIDEAGFYKDLRKTSVEDADVGNFALMHLKQVYDKYAKDNTLTKEQREHYQRKVSEIVNEMADRGIGGGRGSASWAKIYNEDPSFDARVRLVETLKKNRDDLTKGVMPDGKNIQEYIAEVKQEVEKAFAEEINKLLKDNTQLKNAINKLKQDNTRKNIKEQGKEIANLIRKAKAPKDLAFVTIVPIQAIWNPSMEVVAKSVETLTSAVQGAVDMAKIISQAVQEGLNWIKQQKWYKDLTKEEQDRFDKFYEKKATEIAEGKQDVEEVIKQHYSQKNDPRTLIEKLVEDAGLTKQQAQKIKSIVAFEMNKRAKQKLVEIKKNRDTGWKGSSIDKIIEAVQNGNLDEDTWLNSFSEKFGFQPITKEFAQVVKVMVDEIQKLHDEEQYFLKRHVNLELNNLLKKVKKQELKDIFQAINNWQYTMILTGVNTLYNANIGSTLSATLETLPYLIQKGFLPSFFAAKQLKFLPNHFKEFVETTNSHRGFYDHLGLFDESHHSTKESKFEMAMAKPFFSVSEKLLKSIKNKDDRAQVAKFFKEWSAQTLRKSLVVASNIKGWDAMMRGVMADMVYAAEEFVEAAKDLGYNGTLQRARLVANMKDIATIFDNAAKNAGLNKQSIVDAKAQVELDYANKKEHFKQLGIPFPQGYKNRRFLELKMEAGNIEHYKDALLAATDSVMLGTPQGIPGYVYQLIQKMFTYGKRAPFQTGTFLARSFLLFPRISLNFINRVSTNIPVFGVIPSVMGIEIDPKTGDISWQWVRKDTRKMVKSLATHAALMMAGVMLFLDTLDWDDDEDKWVVSPDRHFDFTSYGTGDYGKNRQYGITKPYAMRFRWDNDNEFDEDWFGFYLLPHILPIVGWLGRMMDDDKGIMSETRKARIEERYAERIVSDKDYWNKIKDITRRIPDLGDVSLRAMGEAQYNSISRIIKGFKSDQDKVGAAGRAVLQTLAEPAKTMTQPSIMRDIFNEFYRQQNVPQKETQKQFWAELGKNYYISELFMENDKLDLYGNPIPRDTRFFKFVDMYLKEYGDRPEYKLLTKYENLLRPNMYWLPAKKGYTVEDKYDARDYARKSFGYYVVNSLDTLQDLSKDELELAMNIMWEFSKEDAMYAIDVRKSDTKLSDEDVDKIYERYRSSASQIRDVYKTSLNNRNVLDVEKLASDINEAVLKIKLESAMRSDKKNK